MADPKPRVLFDTGTVLQAALNPRGPASRALSVLDQGQVEAILSPRLRSEYEDVLCRPAIRERYPRLTEDMVEAALARFDEWAQLVPNPPRHIEYPRDPDDEPLLNLAIQVGADYLVTRDKDLLDLAADEAFRRRFPFLRIVDPVAFLEELTARERQQPEQDGGFE